MITSLEMSRRGFLKASGLAAGGLVLAFQLPLIVRQARGASPSGGTLNAFLTLDPEGRVTFFSPFIEGGQGVYTALPQIIADELDVAFETISVEQAPAGEAYKIMFGGTQRFTGGSMSVRSSYTAMRQAGAAARQMLLQAAADRWEVPIGELDTQPGRVVHAASERSIGYGELAEAAGALEPPTDPPLKDPSRFRYIGKPIQRNDSTAKANGSAQFAIDVRLPNMAYAAVKQSPVLGGDVASMDEAAIADRPGVISVERLPGAVAVIADTYWHAQSALDALPVEFENAAAAGLNSEQLAEEMQGRVDEAGMTAESHGDVEAAFLDAERVIEAVYQMPFLAHATMEPMNATADVTAERCEAWVPNQGVDVVVQQIAEITGLSADNITVHTPYIGGFYGRRFITDYGQQAVRLSKAAGRPVQLIWSREQDTQHDYFRPMVTLKHRAAIDAEGKVSGWHVTVVGDGPFKRLMPQFMQDGIDSSALEGVTEQPYTIANRRVDWVSHDYPVKIGFWRSVGHSYNGYVTESFIDEMAEATATDPLEFRRQLLGEAPRYLNVLDSVAEMAGYQPSVQEENGRRSAYGIALHLSFGSIVGEVAKVSIEEGRPRVHKVWCAVDCGSMVNPDTIEAQIQSGISTGLSQTLLEEITIENGEVVQKNFDTYRFLPPSLMPDVEVQIIESGAEMGGIGEVGTPPVAPAVASAVYKLTGQRIRRLPMARHDLTASA
ncbi:isoquinoline 1-oxidoreductase, beta subunit [Modicisalibacter ilicicola DSM 19980]|uniref:Isoquinoline 1-oxidoreductase, beta subunit n=1 Tax=Modicisalibacter ilicicola DSM 19980 TaxID=1121942 RepID=A0A1M4SCU5_9GAMM|nr:xanthine dehydrogenase family protein molybdopterin-binding subunit [Halomonas ilicicola]SHE29965.1 isoquinoline 1-oxidoreductase, beta subunit [Halomonas ilicicola DSM 19980]